jgi:hypothetical protein
LNKCSIESIGYRGFAILLIHKSRNLYGDIYGITSKIVYNRTFGLLKREKGAERKGLNAEKAETEGRKEIGIARKKTAALRLCVIYPPLPPKGGTNFYRERRLGYRANIKLAEERKRKKGQKNQEGGKHLIPLIGRGTG